MREEVFTTTFRCVEDNRIGCNSEGETKVVTNSRVYEIGERIVFVGDPYRVWECEDSTFYHDRMVSVW